MLTAATVTNLQDGRYGTDGPRLPRRETGRPLRPSPTVPQKMTRVAAVVVVGPELLVRPVSNYDRKRALPTPE